MAVEWLLPVLVVSPLSHPAGTLGTLCRRATELHSRAAMNEQVPSPLRRGSARETRESLWSAPLCGGTGRPTLLASAPGSPTSRKHHGWARMPLRSLRFALVSSAPRIANKLGHHPPKQRQEMVPLRSGPEDSRNSRDRGWDRAISSIRLSTHKSPPGMLRRHRSPPSGNYEGLAVNDICGSPTNRL